MTASAVEKETGAHSPKRKMDRSTWIDVHSTIHLVSIKVVTPDQKALDLEAGMKLVRIGSIWYADEEFHIFVMSEIVDQAKEAVGEMMRDDVAVMTPLWVFKRHEDTIKTDETPFVLNLAEKNFISMLGKVVGGKHGH